MPSRRRLVMMPVWAESMRAHASSGVIRTLMTRSVVGRWPRPPASARQDETSGQEDVGLGEAPGADDHEDEPDDEELRDHDPQRDVARDGIGLRDDARR